MLNLNQKSNSGLQYLIILILFIFTQNIFAVWLEKGEANYSETVGVIEDNNKDVIVAGNFVCSLSADTFSVGNNFCDSLENSVRNVFVAKYNTEGEMQWLTSSAIDTSIFYVNLVDFKIDAHNNIILTGSFDSIFVYQNDTLLSEGDRDIFIMKLDTDGNLIWLNGGYAQSHASFIRPSSILVTPTNEIRLLGIYYNNINIGGKTAGSTSSTVFLTMYNSDGSIDNTAIGNNVSVGGKASIISSMYTSQDSIIVMTLVQGRLKWSDADTLTSLYADTTNVALVFMDADSSIARIKQLPLVGAEAFTMDGNKNLFVVGNYIDEMVIDEDTLWSSGRQESFVVKFNISGDLQWSKITQSSGTGGMVDFKMVETSSNNDIFIGRQAGATTSGMNLLFNGNVYNNLPNKQALLVKIKNDGSTDWLQLKGNEGGDFISDIYPVSNVLAYLTGNFSDEMEINNIKAINRLGYQNYFLATADLFPDFIPGITVSGGNTVACDGDSIMMFTDNNPVYTYQWFNGSDSLGTDFEQWASASGNYFVEVTHTVYGFTKPTLSEDILINNLPDSTLYLSGDSKFCAGDSLILKSAFAKSGASYQWYRNNVAYGQDTSVLIIFETASFYVSVQDSATGCTQNSREINTTLLQYPDTILDIHDDLIFCDGDSVYMTTSFDINYSYYWFKEGDTILYPNDTSLYAKQSGEYVLEIVNDNRCSSVSETIGITALTAPEAFIEISGDTLLCDGDSLTIYANSSPGYKYVWYYEWITPDTIESNLFYAQDSGRYSVEVINQIGCTALSNVLHIDKHPQVDTTMLLLGETSFCEGDSVTLAMIQPGMMSYKWFRNNQLFFEDEVGLCPVKKAGTYYGHATNKHGCSARSFAITLTTQPAPDATLGIENEIICNGDSILIEGKIASNTAYKWFYNGNVIGGEAKHTYYAKKDGEYSLLAINTSNECTDSAVATIKLVDYSNLQINVGSSTTICGRDSMKLELSQNEDFTYQWIYENTNIKDAVTTLLYAKNEGDYQAVITNKGLCADTTNSVKVFVLSNPIPNVNQSGNVLSTASYNNIKWYKDGEELTDQASQTHLVEESGLYNVQVKHENGCQATSSSVPVCLPLPEFYNKDNKLTASNGADYQWFIDGDTIPGAVQKVYYAQLTGNYSVAITGDDGCNMQSTKKLICMPYPEISLEEGYILKSTTGKTYQWYRYNELIEGADTRIFVPEIYGIYTVTVNDYDGCVMTSQPYGHLVTSFDNKIERAQVHFAPNPVQDQLHVTISNAGAYPLKMLMYTLSGQKIKKFIIETEGDNIFNVSDVNSGIYLVKVVDINENRLVGVYKIVIL